MEEIEYYLAILGVDKYKLRSMSSREEWAKDIGADRKSLYRWEKEIIDKADPLVQHFYWGVRRGRKCLDFYQKLILALIGGMQFQTGGTRHTGGYDYADLADWFTQEHIDGQWKIMAYSREEMKKWIYS